MEHFILYHPYFEQRTMQLSFLATPPGLQGISQGTPALIEHMLADLGYADVGYVRWSVDHMLSNYLADDPEADNWSDVWQDTWEITIDLVQAVTVTHLPHELIRTYARDTTWYSPHSASRPILPAPAMLVADFYTRADLQRAEVLFAAVDRLRSDAQAMDDIRQLLPHTASVVLNRVEQMFQGSTWFSGRVSTHHRRSNSWPDQLLVVLDPVDQDVLEEAPSPMTILNSLCYELGATTTWKELQMVIVNLIDLQTHFGARNFTPPDAADIIRLDGDCAARYLQGLSEYRPDILQKTGISPSEDPQYTFIGTLSKSAKN